MSDVSKKIKDLFREDGEDKDFDEVHFTNESRLAMEDFTEEEEKEVLGALENLRANKPKFKWNWSFNGRILLKIIFQIIEIVLLATIIYFLLPFAINSSVEIVQACAISLFSNYVRFWWR